MGKGKNGVILTVLILVLVASYYFYHSNELYGNDRDSIVKVIKSIEGYENKAIDILEINDFKDVRIVGFITNNSPSYIEFYKNQKENYVWRHIESRTNESFSMFLLSRESPKFMYVTNNENKIAKLQVDINGTTVEQKFIPHQATVTWVDLPQANKDSYEYRNYKYFDKNDNLIKEY